MTNKDPYHFSWWQKVLLSFAPWIIAFLMRTLNRTCKIVGIEGKEQDHSEVSKHEGRAVYCTWHQRMFYHFHYFGSLHVTMMISKSKDGEWAARVAKHLGFKNVRGSSRKGSVDKGGGEAWRSLVQMVQDGESAGMLCDGPRGPAREAKIGAVLIAKETGAPMIPEMWGCDRAWCVKSWDRYMIPKPFAKVYVIHGDPIYVPPDADKEQLEHYRKLLEEQLNQTAKRCDDYFGVVRPVRKESKENQSK